MANIQNLTPWKPGQSGNLSGRSVGSRTVFSQAFLKDLAEVWSDEGREAMLKTAKTNPTVFFATCARLIPQDVKLTVEQQLPGNLSMEDWQVMREIITAVRDVIASDGEMRELFRSEPPKRCVQKVQVFHEF